MTHGFTNFGDVPILSFNSNDPFIKGIRPAGIGPVFENACLAGPAPVTNAPTDWPFHNAVIVEFYTPADAPFSNLSAYLSIYRDGERVFEDYDRASVTVTDFGAVGGAVSGTFTTVLTNWGTGGPSWPVTGKFRLKRVENGSFWLPK